MSSHKHKKPVIGTNSHNTTRRKLNIKPDAPRIVDSIVDKISALNPFGQSTPESTPPQITEPKYTCEDKKRCPSGYRCDTNNECYKLTNIMLDSNGKNTILSIDGNRNKTYDVDLLNKNIERVIFLKTSRINGKRITANDLKNIIRDLKANLSTIDVNYTYYGTLNDELIIQIIYLESLTKSKKESLEKESLEKESVPHINLPNTQETQLYVSEELPQVDDPPIEILDESHYNLPEPSTDMDMTINEKALQDKIGIPPNSIDSKEYNQFQLKKENVERENINLEDTYDLLYHVLIQMS